MKVRLGQFVRPSTLSVRPGGLVRYVTRVAGGNVALTGSGLPKSGMVKAWLTALPSLHDPNTHDLPRASVCGVSAPIICVVLLPHCTVAGESIGVRSSRICNPGGLLAMVTLNGRDV